MAHISDNWPDPTLKLDELLPEYADAITGLIQSLRFDQLNAYLTSLHPNHAHCHIVRDRYTWGMSFVVFEAVFEDAISWVIRLALPLGDGNARHKLERKILNEVAVLSIVGRRTSLHIPQVIAYHAQTLSSSNPLGTDAPAFLVMTSMPGVHISSYGIQLCNPRDPLPDQSKLPIFENYFRDLVDMHVQLKNITFPAIGSVVGETDGNMRIESDPDTGLGPFTSSSAYFAGVADYFDTIAVADSSDSGEARLQKQFVALKWRSAIMPLIDTHDDHGPFPLRHGDLHSENALVDPQGHIIGIIDWDCAGTVPWEVFGVPSWEVSGFLPGPVIDIPVAEMKENFYAHYVFNRVLEQVQPRSGLPSGRSLSELHNSSACQVGSYLAYYLASMDCNYNTIGRYLHTFMGWGEIDEIFQEFVKSSVAVEVN